MIDEVVRVADAHAAADRRAERHHRGAADVLQPPGQHRVVGRVGQHGEAVVDELLGRGHELDRVGQERPVVADHLELDPVGRERLAGQPRGQHRVAGRVAAGGVRQHLDPGGVEHVEDRARGRAGSSRRMATVNSSVPDASSARGRAARGWRSRRCRGSAASRTPPGDAKGRECASSSLDRTDHLDAVAVGQLASRPTRARHDLAVDATATTPGRATTRARRVARGHRRGPAAPRLAVDAATSSRRSAPARASTTSVAVSGASRMPLR